VAQKGPFQVTAEFFPKLGFSCPAVHEILECLPAHDDLLLTSLKEMVLQEPMIFFLKGSADFMIKQKAFLYGDLRGCG
jgi:hypothetical protein